MGISLGGALQVTLAGLATGSLYALLLLGVLIVYRVSKAVNFSQGQLGMAAAFSAYFLYSRDVFPVWAALIIGLVVATGLSLATERLFIARIARRGRLDGQDLVATLGVMLLLTAAAEATLGTQTRSFVSLGNDTQFTWGSVFVNLSQLVVFLGAALLLTGFALFLRTETGAAMRASAANPDLARTFGVDVDRIKAITWAASGFLAGMVGIVVASRLSVDPYFMTPFLISVFVAGIIGGLDRFVAPLLIAFGLAVYQNWSSYVLGATSGTASLFVLVIVLLAVLPSHLLDERRESRA